MAVARTVLLGKDVRLYYNTGAPTTKMEGGATVFDLATVTGWTLATMQTGAQFSRSDEKAEITVAGSDWVNEVYTFKKGQLEFSIIRDTSDAFCTLIEACDDTKDPIALMVLTGSIDTEGVRGFAGYFSLEAAPEGGLKDALKYNVTCVPTPQSGVFAHRVVVPAAG